MKKIDHSLSEPFVQWFFPKLVPLVPSWMTPNMISILGLVGSVLFVVFLLCASISPLFYVAGALVILSHWVTDTMDGMVARARQQTSSLGYYLDHFGDVLTTAFVGISMFAAGGSHVEIGLACTVLYLVVLNHVHIKVPIFNAMEMPTLGPTEFRFLIICVLIGQVFFDYNRPLSWFPAWTGDAGWVTRQLGFSTGLTFIDVCGITALCVATLGVCGEMIRSVIQIRQLDCERAQR
jgi:hypothetical protein